MMALSKRVRFVIALMFSSGTVIIVLTHLLITRSNGFTRTAEGAWIPRQPPTLEVMAFTILMMGVVALMWYWYRRDRVHEALTMLNNEERRALVDHILNADLQHLELSADGELNEPDAQHTRKRKRI